MKLRNPLFMAVAVVIMSFAVGVMSQGFTDGIKVTLPEPVTVGDQVLDPGEYEIRRASTTTDQVLQIFSNDKMRYETVVLTIPTVGEKTPEESKVVLHHIGDKYYFDKIWMEGKTYGYEFVLPENVQSLQRELALNVPATSAQSTEPAPSANVQSGREAEADQAAESARQAEADRAAQAERERQAQLDREQQAQAERNRVASLQNEQSVAPSTPDSRAAQTPGNIQNEVQNPKPDQLPATASNWLGFLLGGTLLLTLSALFRPSRRQE